MYLWIQYITDREPYTLIRSVLLPYTLRRSCQMAIKLNVLNSRRTSLNAQTAGLEKLQRSGVQFSERLAYFGVMESQLRIILKPLKHPWTMVSRGLRGCPQLGTHLCRKTVESLSNRAGVIFLHLVYFSRRE